VKRINGEARWKQHGRQKLQNKVTTGITGEFINEGAKQKQDITEERNKEEQLKEKKIHRKRIVEEKLKRR